MLNRRKKQIIQDIFLRQSTISFFGFLILIAICVPLVKNINKQYKINSEITGLEKEIKDFEGKNIELKNTFEYLESDQFASEQARINLNYKNEGEEIVVIKSQETEAVKNPSGNTYGVQGLNEKKTIEQASIPVLWWRYFFY